MCRSYPLKVHAGRTHIPSEKHNSFRRTLPIKNLNSEVFSQQVVTHLTSNANAINRMGFNSINIYSQVTTQKVVKLIPTKKGNYELY